MLGADRLIVEDDFATVIGWIYGCMLEDGTHLLLWDIRRPLIGSVALDIVHIF